MFMDYAVLKEKVDAGLSQRAIANACGIGHSTVRYWLKRHGIETVPCAVNRLCHHEHCILCGRRTGGRRTCPSCWTRVRRYRAKLLGIKLLGGKCWKCGAVVPVAAFEFHHVSGKDFSIGSAANKSWSVIVRELKKCQLWCSNCHRVKHSRHDAALIAEAERYIRKGFILGKVAQSVVAPV